MGETVVVSFLKGSRRGKWTNVSADWARPTKAKAKTTTIMSLVMLMETQLMSLLGMTLLGFIHIQKVRLILG